MPISETKMKIVIDNYFKVECDINTSIHEAFEKGFRIGVQKGYETAKPAEITLESAIDYLQSTGWLQEHDRILTESAEQERMRGQWIEINGTSSFIWLRCSECRHGVNCRTNFCPHCGADMRSEE